MAAAVASWKSFVATTETGSGKYGPECAVLAANGMADLARAHFVECVETAFKTTHVPNLRFAVTNGGNRSKSLSPNHQHHSWGWVDAAVPAGVSAFTKAVTETTRNADALEKALLGGVGVDVGKTGRLCVTAKHSVAAIVSTKGPNSFVSVVSTFFQRRIHEFAVRVDETNGDDETNDDDDDDETDETAKENDDDAFAKQVDAYVATGVVGLERQHSLVAPSASHDSCATAMGADWTKQLEFVGACLRGVTSESDVTSGSDSDSSISIFGNACAAAAAAAIDAAICERVKVRASGNFEKKALPELLRWIIKVPVAFLKTIGLVSSVSSGGSGGGTNTNNSNKSDLESAQWRARCAHAAYERLGAQRVHQCFDVIVEFPESAPAVDDLRRCLRRSYSLHSQLVDALKQKLRQRLLIAGAPTGDIIDTYRLTIRALRDLDPSGVVLNQVSVELKEYLRSRKDTIRCVVSMLMGKDGADGEGDFQNGLLSSSGNGNGDGHGGDGLERLGDDDGDLEFLEYDWRSGNGDGTKQSSQTNVDETSRQKQKKTNWDKWEPEPVASEAASSRGRKRAGDDELTQLVSIYGSKEVFIGEYRNMLAERLLSKVGYDVDRETHALELLKLRFGEHNLHKCEVMLKDMRDSKRLNTNIKAPLAPGTPGAAVDDAHETTETLRKSNLDATVVSNLFWPPFQTEAPDFALPSSMHALTATYAERYHHLKAPRKMTWLHNLGTVQMEIMWRDNEVVVTVGPIEAALIHLFQDRSFWSADELVETLKIPKQVLRRKAVVWINNGLLVETSGGNDKTDTSGNTEPGYRLVTETDAKATFGAAAADDGVGASGGSVASAETQAAAGMKVYEQYIIGMLTNFPQLPLGRIHNMLKMFVSEPPYDRTEHQLAAFLTQLIAEDKVVMEGEQFKRRT